MHALKTIGVFNVATWWPVFIVSKMQAFVIFRPFILYEGCMYSSNDAAWRVTLKPLAPDDIFLAINTCYLYVHIATISLQKVAVAEGLIQLYSCFTDQYDIQRTYYLNFKFVSTCAKIKNKSGISANT